MSASEVHVSVDIVVLTLRDSRLRALLIRRSEEPYRGYLALPGGSVGADEDLDQAAGRVLREETAVDIDLVHLEQVAAYGAPRRDPRARTVSVTYLAVLPDLPEPRAGVTQSSAEWLAVEDLDSAELAFDHHVILDEAVERARSKLEYSPLAAAFCSRYFTIAELRRVYEIVWGRKLDPANFHRKVTGADGFIRATDRTNSGGPGRPAKIFELGDAKVVHPPILR
ncbi:NUDIX hydrolase [Solicola sp. PLA-1-18]|uniref:NUDIX hydrolase n=1 Tax=Solicola sp. PLA-1-18 TaxID=3380532 RepID=UPI003B80C29F